MHFPYLLLKRLINRMGYDLRNVKHGGVAFADQSRHLAGREVRTILDLGGHVGETALLQHSMFPGATIHTFEPFEESFQKLVRNCRGLAQIRPHQLAVTNFSGTKQFHYNEFSFTNSLLHGDPAFLASGEVATAALMRNIGSQEVPTITVDDFCKRENIRAIQILKMDVQGGELMALEGAVNMLDSHSVDLIYSEVLFERQYENQGDFLDLCQFLEQRDYVLSGLYELRWASDNRLSYGDAIFLSPQLRRRR